MWKFKFSKLLLRQRVNVDACTGCGICAALCPVNAIEIIDGKAQVGLACEYCQRCAAVCPEKAIRTNGRNYQPYSVANEELLKFWNNKDNTQC
jgi:ferredoxin